jgi:xylose dehydrogenase (NAD/NADP)
VTGVRWGLLSTANIGATVVQATRDSEATQFVAVASRDEGKSRQFADRVGLDQSFGSYEAMVASDAVDAIYVALPVSMHTEWTIKALQAGKHVLCEKPFATTAADTTRCFDAAEQTNRLCVEGLMYRYHPQTDLALELIAQGSIGKLSNVRSALSVSVAPGDIRRIRALGGGALLDLGCYCVSATRLFAGEPERVYAERVLDIGHDPVDLRMSATLKMPDDMLAQFDIGLDLPRRDELELIGTDGKIVISDPWICRGTTVELWRDGHREHLPVDLAGTPGLGDDEDAVYRLEFDRVSAAFAAGAPLPFGREDAIAQACVLEALLESSQRGERIVLDH